MAKTRAALNKAVRQEALRDQLEAQGHVQHVTDILNDLRSPVYKKNEVEIAYEPIDIQRLKVVVDTKLKLINKYLPDQKEVLTTLVGDDENPLQLEVKAVLDIDAIKKKVNDITSN